MGDTRLFAALAASALACGAFAAEEARISIDAGAKGPEFPKSMYGIFFEDINWAADGGLSPELLANGGFDWLQADHEKWNVVEDGWEPDFRGGGMARLSFQYGAPVHPNTAKHLRVESFGAGFAGVRNRGLDGMRLVKGEPYRLQYDVRELSKKGIDYDLGPWARKVEEFKFEGSDLTFAGDGYRVEVKEGSLSLLVRGRRAFEFDNVSLVPTGPNLVRAGLRKDLVDRLDGLKPSFVRFPGGCIVEEGDFQHWYDWRRTVGPKERRECVLNRWAGPGKPYWETFAVGFHEYFVLCEELGAEPLPICLSGLTCQFQKPALLCDLKDVDYFANVILELVEYANGDVSTKWGRVRAETGHPKPFGLKMVGVGNENWNAEFLDRCEPIARIVREKHPEIKIVGSAGPFPDGREFDYAWKRITKESADIVDEHYYRSPEWFLASAGRYDGYDRANKPPVYAGEYACHHEVDKKKVNTHWSAVCEAVAMTGFERNCDVVQMASYAPLFARVGHDQWSPNLIWFDLGKSYATPNYYVQQMFSVNRPSRIVPSTAKGAEFFQVCGFDDKTGEYIVKCVNVSGEPRALAVDFGEVVKAGDVRRISLSGAKLDMNDLANPQRVAPVEDAFRFVGGRVLTTELKPTSLTVLRISK